MFEATGDAIRSYCKANSLRHKEFNIKCGAGTPDATLHHVAAQTPLGDGGIIYLYFHGGGYLDPLNKLAHTPFTLKSADAAGASSTFFLEYTLAPALKYPGQLIQAASALNHLLKTYKPENIIIGGDSAGGNLVLALVAHIKHPKPDVPPVSALKKPFRGLLLISPWVSVEYGAPSYTSNADTDYLGRGVMAHCNTIWQPVPDDVWASPLVGDSDFWSKVPASKVLLTAGDWEVFRDDIVRLAKKMGAGSNGTVELTVADKEVHVQSVIDAVPRYDEGYMTKSILQWMNGLRS